MQQRLFSTALSAFGALLVLYAVIRLFNIDPEPIISNTARLLGGGKLIEFNEAFAEGLDETIRVCSVDRVDTDGDGFREWLVFYQNDPIRNSTWRQPCPDLSPRFGAVYDNDRGEPAILFPYALTPPKRDLLGEQGTILQTAEVVANLSDSELPIEEILVYGTRGGVRNQLTMFTFQQNTQLWELPKNDPPRYKVIGAFEGNGGINYDPVTKNVTTRDRGPYERSQLAIKNVYSLHGDTYMDSPSSKELAAPIESTIDFAFGPPEDLLNTEFPEKIVLGFYQSLDQARDVGWKSEDFLAPIGTDETLGNARRNLDAENYAYFFAGDNTAQLGLSEIRNLSVVELQYYPEAEENPVTRTIAGPQPQVSRVSIRLVGEDESKISGVQIVYEMLLLNGQWKINQRLQ